MATIYKLPSNLRRWSQAPPTSLATSPSPNLLARSRSVHSYKPSQSLPGDTSQHTSSSYQRILLTIMKEWNETICSSSIFIQWSVDVCVYIYIYIEEYIVCWSKLYRTAGHVCILVLNRAWLTRRRCTGSVVLWAFGQLLAGLGSTMPSDWTWITTDVSVGDSSKKTCHFGICLSFVYV